jgi:hypothetical protein
MKKGRMDSWGVEGDAKADSGSFALEAFKPVHNVDREWGCSNAGVF